jgi:beta-lactamase family protein
MARTHIPGVSLAVRAGKVIKAEGYGMADLENVIAVTPQTVFKIGSVSKQFLAPDPPGPNWAIIAPPLHRPQRRAAPEMEEPSDREAIRVDRRASQDQSLHPGSFRP